MAAKRHKLYKSGTVAIWLVFSLCLCVSAVNLSCSSKTDMRSLVPADSLVYLETNDLAAALQPIVDSKPFTEVAKSKPDFSALKGVQLAVAVTGIEMSEEELTDEHSIGRIQPRFVAIIDTHAWNYQALAFTDQKLGQFVTDIYGADVTQDRVDKDNGEYFTWTANDGRKSYAQVIDSLVYFGNDETAIDKCLAVRRGEADSIVKTGKVPPSDLKTLAAGYVSTDGVAQIASIVGLKFASESSEESEVQSAIAGILPQLLRNSITEISWTATKTDQGIEDKYLVTMPPEIAKVFNETMAPADSPDFAIADYFTPETTITVYNLRNPQVAWRSVVLSAQTLLDPLGGKVLAEFADSLFEPYGIRDAEHFLRSVGPILVTAKCNEQSNGWIVIARELPESAKIEESLEARIGPKTGEEGSRFLESSDRNFGAVLDSGIVTSGDHGCVVNISSSSYLGIPSGNRKWFVAKLADLHAAAITIGSDEDSSSQVVDLLSEKKSEPAKALTRFTTETRFTKTGIERRTVSNFGLIGSIIAQLADN